MKNSKEFMDDFMSVWKNMIKYQDIDIEESNYEEVERAFREEKNIVATYEQSENITSEKQRRIDWEKGIKVEGLPILTIEEVNSELEKTFEQPKEQEK